MCGRDVLNVIGTGKCGEGMHCSRKQELKSLWKRCLHDIGTSNVEDGSTAKV